jgi:hypothetical protein
MPVLTGEARTPKIVEGALFEQLSKNRFSQFSMHMFWNLCKRCISIAFDILLICILLAAAAYFYKHREQVLTTCYQVSYVYNCVRWP